MEKNSAEYVCTIVDTAQQYMTDNFGELTCPGRPGLENGVWCVPILCDTQYGLLRVGEIELDETGCIKIAPTREEVERELQSVLSRLQPAYSGR